MSSGVGLRSMGLSAQQLQSLMSAQQASQSYQNQLNQQLQSMAGGQSWPGMISQGGSGGGGVGTSIHNTWMMPQVVPSSVLAFPRHSLRRVRYLPNTLGWRTWHVEADGALRSPSYGTRWECAELHADNWLPIGAVRNVAGIHALLAPECWRDLVPYAHAPSCVHGLVERFGQYVLGEDGWRSEWAVVREVSSNDEKTAAKLEQFYPEVKVHFDPDTEEPINGYRKGNRDRNTGDTGVEAKPDHDSAAGAKPHSGANAVGALIAVSAARDRPGLIQRLLHKK